MGRWNKQWNFALHLCRVAILLQEKVKIVCTSIFGHKPSRMKNCRVLVWIYVGGFSFGSGPLKPDTMAKIPLKGVILVSIAYRVGQLGFCPSWSWVPKIPIRGFWKLRYSRSDCCPTVDCRKHSGFLAIPKGDHFRRIGRWNIGKHVMCFTIGKRIVSWRCFAKRRIHVRTYAPPLIPAKIPKT